MAADRLTDCDGNRLTFSIRVLNAEYSIARLDAGTAIPRWVQGDFVSVTATARETSVVCPSDVVPEQVCRSTGWKCLHIDTVMDFSMIGVIAALTSTLSDAGVSVFVCSTYDTDYILVQKEDLATACQRLRQSGHSISGDT